MEVSVINFNVLNATLMLIMMIVDSIFYYYIKNFVEPEQKKPAYYFMLYFVFAASGFVISGLSIIQNELFIAIRSFIGNSVYTLAYFALRQGIIIRNGFQPPALYKNKMIYLVQFFIVFLVVSVLFGYYYTSSAARLAILTVAHVIITLSALESFKHKDNLSSTDRFLIFVLIVQPTALLLFPIINYTLGFYLNFQNFMFLLFVVQIISVFTWTVSLSVVLLLDVLDLHHNNAITDSMTKTYNRTYFNQYVAEKLQKNVSMSTAFMFVDIDFFKSVNDTYGHDAGDKVIISISQLIKNHIGNEGIVARFGGEEFAIFCEEIDKNSVMQCAENLRTAIQALIIEYEQHTITTTVSIGVTISDGTLALTDELKRADTALYQAKKTGRNKVCFA